VEYFFSLGDVKEGKWRVVVCIQERILGTISPLVCVALLFRDGKGAAGYRASHIPGRDSNIPTSTESRHVTSDSGRLRISNVSSLTISLEND